MKRKDYMSWNSYFMGIAELSAQRSKDPNTQVGACLVSPENKILGIGYNGFPKGIDDNIFPWLRKGSLEKSKYGYVVHAEINAVLNSYCSLSGSTLYTTQFPCNECTKILIQKGITKVIYLEKKYPSLPSTKASEKMLEFTKTIIEKMKNYEKLFKIG